MPWPRCRLEIIFIDDGSRDSAFFRLKRTRYVTRRWFLSSSAEIFGKEAALTAGLDYATGDVVIPIDVDLQGSDRHHSTVSRINGIRVTTLFTASAVIVRTRAREFSDLFYKVFNTVSEIQMFPHAGISSLDRSVVLALRTLPERVRFMKACSVGLVFLQLRSLIGGVRVKTGPANSERSNCSVLPVTAFLVSHLSRYGSGVLWVF